MDTIIQRLYEDNIEGKISDAYSFLRLVKTYTDIKELNAEIIRSFIEKVYVYVYVYVIYVYVIYVHIIYICILCLYIFYDWLIKV